MKEKIIFGYMIFFMVVSQIAGMGGPSLFSGVISDPQSLVCQPTGVVSAVTCFFSNLGIFFRLLTVNAQYAILSSILVVPFVVVVAYALVELIARAIP